MDRKQPIKKIFQILVYIFAAIGLLLTATYFAVRFGLTNTSGIIDRQSDVFRYSEQNQPKDEDLVWNKGEEWQTFETAVAKDTAVLKRVEGETGVPARLIVSMIAVEQLRLFFSEREVFKQVFAPLKILGSQTQFSWGVAGIKQETAIQIEEHLKNPASPYYLGKPFEHYLDFKTADIDQERFARITDSKDRYFAYLYAALYIKEFENGWKKSGTDISKRPEIIGTLYNIGFENSRPNPNPQVGGAEIEINGKIYSFGGLAGEFYWSNELTEFFPK